MNIDAMSFYKSLGAAMLFVFLGLLVANGVVAMYFSSHLPRLGTI